MSSNTHIGTLRVGGQPARAQVWSRKMRTLVVQTTAKPEPLVQAPYNYGIVDMICRNPTQITGTPTLAVSQRCSITDRCSYACGASVAGVLSLSNAILVCICFTYAVTR